MRFFDQSRRKFAAGYVGDLSKAIFAVALASKFFIELPIWLRISLPVVGVFFFIAAYFIYPGKQGGA